VPKLERLDWVRPLSEGRGVTLTDDPAADMFLAENPTALLLGVLYDSQFQTRRAFAIPLTLRDRLGHFDVRRLAEEPESVGRAFTTKPALHRFPNRCAQLTTRFASVIVEEYAADAARVWKEAGSPDQLSGRLIALPAFGPQKTNWTVGMLGRLGLLGFEGWDGYLVPEKTLRKKESDG
jgi:uncharacterized HhH-GPD family protein